MSQDITREWNVVSRPRTAGSGVHYRVPVHCCVSRTYKHQSTQTDDVTVKAPVYYTNVGDIATEMDERFTLVVAQPWTRTTSNGMFLIGLPYKQTLRAFSTPLYYGVEHQKVRSFLTVKLTAIDPFEPTEYGDLRAIAHVMLEETNEPAAVNVYNNVVRVSPEGSAYFPDLKIEGDISDFMGSSKEANFYVRVIVVNKTKHMVARAVCTRGFYITNGRYVNKRKADAREKFGQLHAKR